MLRIIYIIEIKLQSYIIYTIEIKLQFNILFLYYPGICSALYDSQYFNNLF